MTLHVHSPNPNAFVRFMRKVYNPIGFKKGYNFTLFFIFAGALLGFILARLSYLDVNGRFKAGASPGEWFWYSKRFYRIGITMHLCCVLPAGLLAILQFVPIIRYKLLIFHRINGYLATLLLIMGNVGALMIARHAFGGTLSTQSAVGTLAILTTTSLVLAIYNIKRLQIEQHRAWMLRTWFYAGSIITLRLIQVLAALVISSSSYYQVVRCGKIAFTSGQSTADTYAACQADPTYGLAAVHADLSTPKSGIEAGVALELSFGMAIWLALFLHAIAIEIYLRLTPAEFERLRKVSYERQMERGFKHPGSAGLTVDRLGDAEPWIPPTISEGKLGVIETVDQGEMTLKVPLAQDISRDVSASDLSRPASVMR